jgi:predicted signal transduction protein with EAL and GGDEF domain
MRRDASPHVVMFVYHVPQVSMISAECCLGIGHHLPFTAKSWCRRNSFPIFHERGESTAPMSVESSWKPFNRDTTLPSSQAMSQVVTRVIATMMMGSSVLFALYLVVEFLQTGDVRELFVIRFTGTVVLITCTFIWIRARNAYRNGLSAMAGLVFITTISICTTLATYYGDERFHIAMAHGFVIAVFNILLWRSMSSFILGVVGALAAPMTLMFAQHPSSDDLIDYLSLTVVTVALSFMVFIIQQRVVAEIVNLNSELIAKAGRDDLTGLMNRRGWAERVTEWEQAHPNAASSLLYMDIDRFKYLNDRFGTMLAIRR